MSGELDRNVDNVCGVTRYGKPVREQFDEDYYLRGVETGKSLYVDYRWMPNLTVPMVKAIVEHCGMTKDQTILDFGCARGYVVKALRWLEYQAYGVDISKWAVENADPEARPYINQNIDGFHWIIAKDVLEHIPYVVSTIDDLMATAMVGVFAVVPLSKFDRSDYVIKDYERDVTHTQRYTLASWVDFFVRPGWTVEASYSVAGVKDNYSMHPRGNGFLLCKRIKGWVR